MAAASGNEVEMKRIMIALLLAFVLGGVLFYAKSYGTEARVQAIEDRLNRRDAIDAEFRQDVKAGLTEIRNKLDTSLASKGTDK